MPSFRRVVASLALVGVFFLLYVPRPWNCFVPAAVAVLVALAIAPVSLGFTVVVLTLLGPVTVLAFLFLMVGDAYPGSATEHLWMGLTRDEFMGILAPPVVGTLVWLLFRYLTRRSSGPLARPLN